MDIFWNYTLYIKGVRNKKVNRGSVHVWCILPLIVITPSFLWMSFCIIWQGRGQGWLLSVLHFTVWYRQGDNAGEKGWRVYRKWVKIGQEWDSPR